MPRRMGVAIIGATGLAGTGHLAGCQALPDAEVSRLWDRSLDRARALEWEWGVPRVAAVFQEAMDRDDIVIVSICTPDHLHADRAISELEAGKHVL